MSPEFTNTVTSIKIESLFRKKIGSETTIQQKIGSK
jgi:hypothetical protein